ncbi:hypothetical protein [Rhodocyclus gracilis]|uniref:hypothetical protein n=1 Tax=Rhodocyclus gracilis TaxID=2929842 RepID=UPI00188E3100|nr:hypothetical protein [Rhodocyclus gracilis]
MQAPMILPWIAHRAGIGEALALKLWRRAVGEAEQMSVGSDRAEYYRLAVERFIDLADSEADGSLARSVGSAHAAPRTPSLAWVWRHQTRMSYLGLVAAKSACTLWQQQWAACIPTCIPTSRAAEKRAA